MDRLSSNYLSHFKTELKVVKLIFEKGFRHNMLDEKVIFRDSTQQNFVVCFCDILAEQAAYHKKCYGNNAIVMTKEWGIKNGISPMRYVHVNSVGQSPSYIQQKNINRDVWFNNAGSNQHYQYAIEYLSMGLLKDNGQLTQPSIAQSDSANPIWDVQIAAFDNEFNDLENELKKTGRDKILYKYLHCIGNRLLELHNELENRDAFMRVYQDDFPCPAMAGTVVPGKILYDEREWRSVKFFGNQAYQTSPDEVKSAYINKFLPESFNLKFTSSDFVALLVENEVDRTAMLSFLQNNKSQLNYSIDKDKIMLFKDFKEIPAAK